MEGNNLRVGDARELETLETLDFDHIPSLNLVSWLYQGPYENENGSPTSSGHDDGFFEDPPFRGGLTS